MIQSGLRRAVAASAAQAGEGDWIINSLPEGRPSGTDSDSVSWQSYCKKFMFRYERRFFICPGDFPGQIKELLLRTLGASAVRPLF